MNSGVHAEKRIVLCVVFLFASSVLSNSFLPVRAAGQVTIVNRNGYVGFDGLYQIYGEVQNTGDVPVRGVILRITLYGASHEVLDSDPTDVMPGVLPVGGKASFGYSSGMAGSEVNDYAVETELFTETSEKPLGLEISSPTSAISGTVLKKMTVTGQVKNTGTETANYIRIYATFFDGPDRTGNVVGVASSSAIPTLDAGASTSFTIKEDVTNRESSYVSYVLNAESEEYATTPVTVPEFPASFIPVLLMMAMVSLVSVFVAKKRLSRQ